MPIYDNDGTTSHEIGKLYDNNGSANAQIGKVYDNNGTTNSLIYSAEQSYANAEITLSGQLLSDYYTQTWNSGSYDFRGFSAVSFTPVNNNARVYFWTGGGQVYAYSSSWQLLDTNGTLIASGAFGSRQTVNISNLSEARKQGMYFVGRLHVNISTVTGSAFSGSWTFADIVAS